MKTLVFLPVFCSPLTIFQYIDYMSFPHFVILTKPFGNLLFSCTSKTATVCISQRCHLFKNDLRASETVELKAGEFKLIPLGVAMQLPKGYEAHVVPRSSTFKNYGLLQVNSCGIIDGSYCGDDDMWRMPVYATRDTVVNVNDRICQFRIVENQPQIVFK